MNTHPFLIMGIPALVALAGGILATFWTPSHARRGLIQRFTAGVVLAALAVELLPEISREHTPGLVLAGSFALGSLFIYALKLWTTRTEQAASQSGAVKGLSTGLLLVTEKLIMETHEVEEKPISTLMLFAGASAPRKHPDKGITQRWRSPINHRGSIVSSTRSLSPN